MSQKKKICNQMEKKSINVEMIHISKNLSFAHLKLLFHA